MSDIIAFIILAGLLLFALKGSLKHFRGEGGCCGGASGKAEKKKLEKPVIGKVYFQIEGMHCSNCAAAVTRAINRIDGVSAKVKQKTKTAVVSYDRDIDPEAIIEAVRQAGYEAKRI